jgi:hypothetical protein
MKKLYATPELEVTLLMSEDILNESPENEIGIPSDDLWD